MPALPLSREQLADAARLKALVQRWQTETRDRTGTRPSQDDIAKALEIDQSSTNQYLNGRIPLNATFASKISRLIGVDVRDFSPQIADQIDSLTLPSLVPRTFTVDVDGDDDVLPPDSTGRLSTLGQRLAHAMYRGLDEPISAAELSRMTGVTRANLSLILNGTTKTLLYPTAELLADALKIRVEWLASGRGEMRSPPAVRARLRGEDELEIPQLGVVASMGAGLFPPDHVDVVKMITVSVSELRKRCSFSAPQNLHIITGLGQSMSPTFQDGDPLLVDAGVSDVRVDAVYVYELDGELYIKRLQRMPGKRLRVISDNREAFDSYDLDAEQIERMIVRGQIILGWNTRRP